MTTMISSSSSSHYNDLSDFLTKHSNSKTSGNQKTITHTRIGNQELNVYPGAYCIEPCEMQIFRKLYYEHVFVKNRKEYCGFNYNQQL